MGNVGERVVEVAFNLGRKQKSEGREKGKTEKERFAIGVWAGMANNLRPWLSGAAPPAPNRWRCSSSAIGWLLRKVGQQFGVLLKF